MLKDEALKHAAHHAEVISTAVHGLRMAEVAILVTLLDMVEARSAALAYLVEFVRTGQKPGDFDQVVKIASGFDCP